MLLKKKKKLSWTELAAEHVMCFIIQFGQKTKCERKKEKKATKSRLNKRSTNCTCFCLGIDEPTKIHFFFCLFVVFMHNNKRRNQKQLIYSNASSCVRLLFMLSSAWNGCCCSIHGPFSLGFNFVFVLSFAKQTSFFFCIRLSLVYRYASFGYAWRRKKKRV